MVIKLAKSRGPTLDGGFDYCAFAIYHRKRKKGQLVTSFAPIAMRFIVWSLGIFLKLCVAGGRGGMYDRTMQETKIVSWEAPEFEYRHKGVSWYWLTIIIAVSLVAVAAWQRNFLFGVFVVIAEVLVLAWGSRTPSTVAFLMNEKELIINKAERYPWEEFVSFGAEEDRDTPTLTFRFRHRVRPVLRILVPTTHFAAARGFVAGKIPQVNEPRSFIETLEELLRF